MAERGITAKFSASTADFEEGVLRIKKSLVTLNTQLEENKQQSKATNKEIELLKKQQTELAKALESGANRPVINRSGASFRAHT